MVDITVSILVLPISLPYILYNRYGWLLEDSTAFCATWGMLWYVFAAMTIFLVAMLSISRTIQIVCPFRNLKKKIVIGVIAGYLLLLLLQSTIPLWVGETYIYEYSTTVHCTWRNTILNGTSLYRPYTQIIFFENYFPIFPIIISCVLTIRSLKRSDNNALNRANREVTVTIILFTVLYMLCNLPPVAMHLLTIIGQNYNVYLMSWDQPYWYFFKFYTILLVPINSALNPLLYMWRMRKMRESTHTLFRRCARVANEKIGSPLSAARKISMTAVTRV